MTRSEIRSVADQIERHGPPEHEQHNRKDRGNERASGVHNQVGGRNGEPLTADQDPCGNQRAERNGRSFKAPSPP